MFISIKKMWSICSQKNRVQGLVLLALMLIGAMLEMLGVGLVIPLVSVLMQDDIATKYPMVQPLLNYFGNPDQAMIAAYSMIGLLGVYLVKNLFLGFLVWKQRDLSYRVRTDVGRRLFSNYLYQPYSFHQKNNSAQLIRNISGEVSILTSYGVSSLLILFTEGLAILGILGLLVFVEPFGAGIIVLTVGPISIVVYWLLKSKVVRWGKERQYHDGLVLKYLQQGLGGVKDTKVRGCEDVVVDEYDFHHKKSSKIAQWEQTLQAIPRLWIEMVAIAGLVALVIILSQKSGRQTIDMLPVLGLFAASAFRLMPSLSRVLSALNAFHFAQPVIILIDKEMRLQREKQSFQILNRIQVLDSQIELKGLDFTYESTKTKILDKANVVFDHNQSIGIIGKSGAGKSTIADLILGLLSPDSGAVLVDGRDIQDDITGWRSQIGYVPQSVFLIDDSLKRNIAFGVKEEDINEEAVWFAIKSAQLEEFVGNEPEGLGVIIGERGVRLSGGQRQRVGIARALYHNPAVLILDEATSALDVATESSFMKTIYEMYGKRTLLIIAHRLSTIKHCDKVYRMVDGRLVDDSLSK
jgi:ABC-type multidrug transport system fused ATPase/permease subunit